MHLCVCSKHGYLLVTYVLLLLLCVHAMGVAGIMVTAPVSVHKTQTFHLDTLVMVGCNECIY